MSAAWSDAAAGPLRPDPGRPSGHLPLAGWASRVADGPVGARPLRAVLWMEQVHGSTVLVGGAPEGPPRRRDAPPPVIRVGTGDALVTDVPGVGLAALTADCASVALGSPEGIVGAVHAGWRGLVDGVLPEAARVMRARGATSVYGALGPCIHAECYEFSEPELQLVVDVLGEGVRSRTADGRAALDVPTAVAAAMVAGGVTQVPGVDACTGCGGGYFSHRARRDEGRQAMVVWSTGTEIR